MQNRKRDTDDCTILVECFWHDTQWDQLFKS